MKSTMFKESSEKDKALILSFLKEQNIIDIQFNLKQSGKEYLSKKCPEESMITPGFKGTIEDISENILRTKKLMYYERIENMPYDNSYHVPLGIELKVPVECIDDIKIIYRGI